MTTKTNFKTTNNQMKEFAGRFIERSNLIFVDKYGIVHTNMQECIESNRSN